MGKALQTVRSLGPLWGLALGQAFLTLFVALSEFTQCNVEILHLPHWSYAEMHAAFGLFLEQYLYLGGYPGQRR